MSEITRTVQIQITMIGDEKEFNKSAEEAKRIYKNMFVADTDQVLVEVKDFIRDGDTAETHQN